MDFKNIENQIDPSWHRILQPMIESPMFDEIISYIRARKELGKVILPDPSVLFRAFKETKYEDMRVILLAQDPYYSRKGDVNVADGLAFSCSNTGVIQPSLEILYRGIEEDLADGMDLNMFKNPDLTHLAKQGVLLLNSALTVELNDPDSHTEVWRPFMKELFFKLNEIHSGLVFMLLGAKAQYHRDNIAPFTHWVVEAPHPAQATHTGGKWNHGKIFSRTNEILKKINNVEIKWYDTVKETSKIF